ncbi:carbohydrate-binding module family 20 domain-containing protein [Luteimicrobium sp. DT211]|uniref:carbohydrate-binding module family 20 domain-containing protein n=1 Tax=Luteimicrobium sp. DT211 TaxID=3393412 RepID=UPI003CF982F3
MKLLRHRTTPDHPRTHRARRTTAVAAATTLLASSLVGIATTTVAPTAQATAPGAKNVTAVLFQWPWTSVARECTDSLGPDGYGYVQVSPPTDEPRLQDQWWTSYQPVSYTLNGKEGTRQQFADMVKTCNDAGVKVIVDTIVNHMSGTGSIGAGSVGGETFSKYDYPGLYSDGDFHSCRHDIANWGNKTEVQTCELVGLSDLDTGSDYVRGKIAGYLNDLLSLGVTGFRIDAAKHVNNADLQAIKAKLTNPNAYWAQEDISDATVPASDYYATGDVHDFAYASQLKSQFGSGQIKNLASFGPSWGILPSEHASVFVSNHDTERNGNSLSYKDGAAYTLANTFMLAYPDGSPSIQSGYAFTNADAGPAVDSTGHVKDAVCGENGWLCVHSQQPIVGMVGFHNAVGDAAVNSWWDDGDNQIAFGRGNKGFVVINHEGGALTHTFRTSLPAGTYCDVVSTDPKAASCDSSHTVTVGADGTFTATVPAQSALAIDVDSTTTGGGTTDPGDGGTDPGDGGSTTGGATVYYSTDKGWPAYDIHYQVGAGAWTTAPGVAMSAACTGWVSKTIDLGAATTLAATFNNGSGTWDNNGSKNYALKAGVSAVKDGVVTTTSPCAGSPGGGDTGTGTGDGTTAVTFAVTATTVFGQNVFVVGSTAALGSWDTSKAVALSSASYPVWKGIVSLPAGTTAEYKYVRKNADGSVAWESGANRTTTPSGSSVAVSDTWRN